MKFTFEPLNDRLAVRRLQEQEVSEGGIHIPDTAKEKPQQGVVLSVGPGGTDIHGVTRAIRVDVGARILFNKYAGVEVELDGEELIIMREEEVLGILRDKPKKK